MIVPRRGVTGLLLMVVVAGAATAGEVIGNTYISEKDGVIEISAPAWNIKDTETAGSPMLAELTVKQPLDGMVPKVQFFRLANPGGVIQPDFLIGQIRDGLAKQGAEVGQIEPRRVAGKRILTTQFTVSRDGGRAHGLIYMLRGDRALYWAQFYSNVVVWEQARPLFDELMEKVKY